MTPTSVCPSKTCISNGTFTLSPPVVGSTGAAAPAASPAAAATAGILPAFIGTPTVVTVPAATDTA